MALVQYDDVVKASSFYGTGQALDVRVLPGTSWGCQHFFDAEAAHSIAELGAVDVIAVAEQVLGAVLNGKASTICWAVHWLVGFAVTLKCRTRRL